VQDGSGGRGGAGGLKSAPHGAAHYQLREEEPVTQHVYCVTGQWRHTRSGSRGRQRCECAHTCAAQYLVPLFSPKVVSSLPFPVVNSTVSSHDSGSITRIRCTVSAPCRLTMLHCVPPDGMGPYSIPAKRVLMVLTFECLTQVPKLARCSAYARFYELKVDI